MAGLLRKMKKSLSLKLSSSSSSDSSPSPRPSNLQNDGVSDGARSSSLSHSSPSSISRISRSISTNLSSKKNCAICLDKVSTGQGQAIFTAECSHSFHFNCIVDNVDHGNLLCPICRSKWKDIPIRAPTNVETPHRNSTGGTRVAPYVPVPEFLGTQHDLRPRSLSHFEPLYFSDDESLPSSGVVNRFYPTSEPEGVTLKTFTEFPAVSASESPSTFAVLVSIRAPPLHVNADHLGRAPIDLVAVLDVSGSMSGAKLSLLKQAVRFVVQNLGPSDRLSIVAFSSTAQRILPLRRMSDTGREGAIQAVDSLRSIGGTDIVGGLTKGSQVLEERQERNPVAGIILLSDGKDTYNCEIGCQLSDQYQTSNPRQAPKYLNQLPASIYPSNTHSGDKARQPIFPVHTFGFGLDHDSIVMHAISDASGGTFSFIESVVMIQDAFARCIGGLLSVVVQEVRVTVSTVSPGLRIGSIHSGSYPSTISHEGGQGVIKVENLYAEEEKEFLVDLSIPALCTEGKEREEKTALLDVFCSYKDSLSSRMDQVVFESIHVRRPQNLSPTDRIVSLEIDRQRNRIMVAEGITKAQVMAEAGNLEGAQALLAQLRATLLSSASAQTGDCLCNRLDDELKEIGERMASLELYKQTGRAFLLSGLSSHSWQRATTRGDSTTQTFVGSRELGNSNSSGNVGYDTPSMVSMVTKSQVLNVISAEQPNSSNLTG